MFAPGSSSLRYTLPRADLYAKDRQSGAYPTRASTGDRTRTGRNKYFFDDAQTVIFATGVNVSMPTTFRSGTKHLAVDLASNIMVSLGNTLAECADQWVPHRDQSERPGPFIEDKLFEQGEHAVVNSSFMTGAAYSIAPGNFKSGVSSKTIIRITIPMTQQSVLSANSSSMYYLNTSTGKFDFIDSQRYNDFNGYSRAGNEPTAIVMFDPILFGPFGYLNCPNAYSPIHLSDHTLAVPSKALFAINNFVPNGSNVFDPGILFAGVDGTRTSLKTGSLIHTGHSASVQQSIDLSQYLSQPFLLEKAFVEMPFAAGPGWMNDSYAMNTFALQDPSTILIDKRVDAGGPMITVALLRQDNAGPKHRDLIASATFTNALEVVTASYLLASQSLNITGSNFHTLIYTRTGLSGTVDPTFVCYGPVVSGSTNFYTGSVRLPMTPAVTQHITRVRVSGSNTFGYYGANTTVYGGPYSARRSMADLMTFGTPTRRPGVFESGRSILGNNVALLSKTKVDGSDVPIQAYESDFENLNAFGNDTKKTQKAKVYWDLVTATRQSPYLLYPKDRLILSVNKHRAVANTMSFAMDVAHPSSTSPSGLQVRALHDAKFLPGSVTITLYGDLVSEDREFHDTLNQRLETQELWETVGDEPVLDQFDVVYTAELSGSYVDRFTVFNSIQYKPLSSSLETSRYFSNVTLHNNLPWSTQYSWSRTRMSDELRKNTRPIVHRSTDEIFWDTRIPNPKDCMKICNPNFRLAGYDFTVSITNTLYTGLNLYGGESTIQESALGIYDWGMTYPYESRYLSAAVQFSNTLNDELFSRKEPGLPGSNRLVRLSYGDLTMQVGSGSLSLTAGERDANLNLLNGMTSSEFIKTFFGIGDGHSDYDNQHVTFRGRSSTSAHGVDIRGWRHGMMSAFPMYTTAMFRRDKFGQFRDMLEQRLDARFYNQTVNGLLDSPVRVAFYDRVGNPTDSILTLSSNLSTEATSSFPYTDGQARNRSTIDYGNLNISPVTF